MSVPFQLIDQLKQKAGYMAFGTPFYDWSLGKKKPDHIVVKPVDPWPGDKCHAEQLLNAAGVGARTGARWFSEWWEPEETDEIWMKHMHSFGWLRDLRTLGGPVAKEQGRIMIENWVERYEHWHKESWDVAIIGRRLSMWICHFDYFCADASNDFEDRVLQSMAKQAQHLSNSLSFVPSDVAMFYAAKGLLYAGIAFEDGKTDWMGEGLNLLEKAIAQQIYPDGGHISRNPVMMLEILEILVDIRSALKAGAYSTPSFIKKTIENMSAALRCLRYRDRKFGLFNGAQEGDVVAIDSILAQAGTQKKTRMRLEQTGYERLELGRALLLFDTGKIPPNAHDKDAHAAPLSFEFCYGKERLLTSCGAHPIDPAWKEALRFTAAHNTACLDHRNACEIKKDGHFGRKVSHVDVQREESTHSAILMASHNGYEALNGITHTRKIFLGDDGHDLRGEDVFTSDRDIVNPVEISVRFHVHPDVTMTMTQESGEILLRMPGGIGWRFRQSGFDIELEDSLYCGQGFEIRKTKQICLKLKMCSSQNAVKWSLKQIK